ncbi:hypothetical protein SEA_FRANSOYER_41 [Microbacterium phage Fransoyer]|nr:minor tail protein [Microbacterium phage SadLad]UUG69606.1 hypothetical protein SEA_FRANSOYER_41 [Microbacterium phage Fransoyer]
MPTALPPGRCATHRAMIFDRGGTRRKGPLSMLSEVRWSRDRDGVSEASVTIQGVTACSRQRKLLREVSAKRHELVIYRGDERVWEGPIFRISDEGDEIKLFAKDVLAYLFGTPLTRVWDNGVKADGVMPVTTRLERIIRHELTTSRVGRTLGGGKVTIPAWESLNPPVNLINHLDVRHFPNEAGTAAKTRAFEMTVGEHLANYGRSGGLDFTAVGRRILLWDTSRNLGTLRTMTEADIYGNVYVTDYGADHTQAAYVLGQDGVYGEAVNPEYLDLYGPWSTVFNAYNEEGTQAPTVGELNSQAARNVSGRSPVPVEVRVPDNSTVVLSEKLMISDLVPGVRVPLRATLNARALSQDQKLDHVQVIENGRGESVQITLTPATRPDSDTED